MNVTGCAVSFTVDDPFASSHFLQTHFGFREQMSADGFVALERADTAMRVVFLRCGIEVLPESLRDRRADGVILALVVTGIDAEEARLRADGVPFVIPLRTEPWGERLLVVADPNGVLVELAEWVTE